MRTKEQLVALLAEKKTSDMVKDSVWGDVISGINGLNQANKDKILSYVNSNNSKAVGEIVIKALFNNSKERAVSFVSSRLIGSTISIDQLDELI